MRQDHTSKRSFLGVWSMIFCDPIIDWSLHLANVNNGVQQGKTGLSSEFCRCPNICTLYFSHNSPRGVRSYCGERSQGFCKAMHAAVVRASFVRSMHWVIVRSRCETWIGGWADCSLAGQPSPWVWVSHVWFRELSTIFMLYKFFTFPIGRSDLVTGPSYLSFWGDHRHTTNTPTTIGI